MFYEKFSKTYNVSDEYRIFRLTHLFRVKTALIYLLLRRLEVIVKADVIETQRRFAQRA